MLTESGKYGNPVCGDIMKIFLKVENNIITDAKFKTFGCGAAIASSSMATELVRGKTLEEAWEVSNKAVAEALEGLPRSRCTVRCWPRKASTRLSTITGRNTGCLNGKRRTPISMIVRKTWSASISSRSPRHVEKTGGPEEDFADYQGKVKEIRKDLPKRNSINNSSGNGENKFFGTWTGSALPEKLRTSRLKSGERCLYQRELDRYKRQDPAFW